MKTTIELAARDGYVSVLFTRVHSENLALEMLPVSCVRMVASLLGGIHVHDLMMNHPFPGWLSLISGNP